MRTCIFVKFMTKKYPGFISVISSSKIQITGSSFLSDYLAWKITIGDRKLYKSIDIW